MTLRTLLVTFVRDFDLRYVRSPFYYLTVMICSTPRDTCLPRLFYTLHLLPPTCPLDWGRYTRYVTRYLQPTTLPPHLDYHSFGGSRLLISVAFHLEHVYVGPTFPHFTLLRTTLFGVVRLHTYPTSPAYPHLPHTSAHHTVDFAWTVLILYTLRLPRSGYYGYVA